MVFIELVEVAAFLRPDADAFAAFSLDPHASAPVRTIPRGRPPAVDANVAI